MKIKASLKGVRSNKDEKEDITQTLIFHVWATPEEIGRINALYLKPIEITIEEAKP